MSELLFLEKIDKILKKHLSEKSFELWIGIQERIPNKCWGKLSSSSKKYHRKEDEGNRVPSCAEHTYEMMHVADKIIDIFDKIIKTQNN